MRRMRFVVVGLAWAGLLFFFFLRSQASNRDTHKKEVVELLDLQRAHEELQHELSLSRSDVQHSSEGIDAAFAAVQTALAKLQRGGALDASPECRAFLRAYCDDLDRACEHAERAALASAEWRSALQRMQHDVELFDTRSSLDPARRRELVELLANLVLFELSGDVAPDPRIVELLSRLRGARDGSGLATDIELSIHAKAELDGETALVDAPGLEKRVQQLIATHESAFNSRADESELYRLGMYFLSVVLLVRLLHKSRELKKRTRELHEANQGLEERVAERTRRLSAANATLQVEVVDRQRAEQETRGALEAAKAASRTKSEFLANMSHEIRTPMTSILGFSEQLLDKGLSDADKVEAITTIRRNGDYLLQIINDILDISKIEAGKLAIERIACSPRRIVAEVCGAMDARAAMGGIDFSLEWKGKVPETIVTDPVRVKQIMLNLLGNAIKFTPSGSVQLSIELVPAAPSPKMRFTVKDTGIGMDEATIARLFKPFTQADSSTTRRFGGTGLGLSISGHLVERLGGRISVTSRLGAGTTFAFTIDTGDLAGVKLVDGKEVWKPGDPAEACVRRIAPVLHGARILLVEDGEDNRRLLGYILTAAEACVESVANGQEAIDAVHAAELAGHVYDVIVMDMQMPVLDGYSATRGLRERGCRSPILALTAHAMATDRQKCIDAGCDDFCTKPIMRNVFLEMVARLVGKSSGEPRALLPAPAGNGGVSYVADAHGGAHDGADGDDPELAELVRLFVVDLAADAAAMRTAFAAGDLETLAHLAHRLKGAAGSYGFPDLTTQAAALERRAKSGADKSELASDLEGVLSMCEAARAGRGL